MRLYHALAWIWSIVEKIFFGGSVVGCGESVDFLFHVFLRCSEFAQILRRTVENWHILLLLDVIDSFEYIQDLFTPTFSNKNNIMQKSMIRTRAEENCLLFGGESVIIAGGNVNCELGCASAGRNGLTNATDIINVDHSLDLLLVYIEDSIVSDCNHAFL